MAMFKYKKIRTMEPKIGCNYATSYYKQSAHEYTKLDKHIRYVVETVINTALAQGCFEDLEAPLKGYKRTGGRANYSALDILTDMLTQVNAEKDIPSGMLGRWNKLFEDNPDLQIEFEEEKQANPIFNKLFV